MSAVHDRDIATVVNLALMGRLDGHVVNVSDDGPPIFFELFQLVGATLEPVAYVRTTAMAGGTGRAMGE